MAKVQWLRDSILEVKLTELGMRWEVVEIHLSNIDFEGSKANNARLTDPYRERLVEQYYQVMRTSAMPMIAVKRISDKKPFTILAGVHRTGAALKHKATTAPVYVCDSDDPAHFDIVVRCSNSWCGEKQSNDEAVQQGIYLMEQHGISDKLAAVSVCLGLNYFRRHVRFNYKRAELQVAGVDATALQQAHLEQLFRVEDVESVQLAAAKLASKSKMSAVELKGVIDDVKRTRSEAGGLRVIREKQADLREVSKERKRGSRAPKAQIILRLLKDLDKNVGDAKSLQSLGLHPSKRVFNDVCDVYFRLTEKMDKLFYLRKKADK